MGCSPIQAALKYKKDARKKQATGSVPSSHWSIYLWESPGAFPVPSNSLLLGRWGLWLFLACEGLQPAAACNSRLKLYSCKQRLWYWAWSDGRPHHIAFRGMLGGQSLWRYERGSRLGGLFHQTHSSFGMMCDFLSLFPSHEHICRRLSLQRLCWSARSPMCQGVRKRGGPLRD